MDENNYFMSSKTTILPGWISGSLGMCPFVCHTTEPCANGGREAEAAAPKQGTEVFKDTEALFA